MSTTNAAQADSDAPEPEVARWPLLPDNNLRPRTAPVAPAKIVRFEDPVVRRSAIAITTDLGILRRIASEEARLEHPRQEMLAMVNQQIDRVETMGLADE